jgi:hypothetical protein
MDLTEVRAMWQDASDRGKLVWPKHDPSGIGTPEAGFKSVTVQASPQVNSFLQSSGTYKATRYHNADYPKSPEYILIEPNDPKYVVGSGIPSNSTSPTHPLNCLVAVSGAQNGWHVYAEDLAVVQKKVADKKLIFMEYL